MAGTCFLNRSILAAVLCAALPALAGDEGVTLEYKLGAGLTAGALRTDQGANQAYGFGLGVRRPYGAGTLTLDLSYDILAGQALDRMPVNQPVYGPSGTGLATTEPGTGNPYFLRPNESIDFRKESASGFSLRGGYAAPLGAVPGLSWQAGVSLDVLRTSSEFTGTLRPMYLNAGGTPVQATQTVNGVTQNYYEGFAFVQAKASLVPGLYVGLRQQLGQDFALELNARDLGARHYDYRPTTYTGQPAALESSTHRGFLFQICLAMSL